MDHAHHFMPPPNNHGIGRGDRPSRRAERPLSEISVTVWLTSENAAFSVKNGLLYLTLNGEETRVTLFRQFPFDLLWEYISVLDEEEREMGIVRSVDLFEEETRELLVKELKKRYYTVTVTKLLSVKERFGFSYWRVETNEGERKFTLRDTLKNIACVNGTRVFFTDVNGNRFEVPDLASLDTKSRRKLELYL